MSLYVDPIMRWKDAEEHGIVYHAHLAADTEEELEAAVTALGHKVREIKRKDCMPHLEIDEVERQRAIDELGAESLGTLSMASKEYKWAQEESRRREIERVKEEAETDV